jgi:LuxR family maltose regulon positive regulatory protein
MATPLLATKLYIPPPRPQVIPRPRLIERLSEGLRLGRKLTLIAAPAGFGKTTLFSEWIALSQRRFAWLSLDEGDNDPARFLAYLVAALQTIDPSLGSEALSLLEARQPQPPEMILTALINAVAQAPHQIVLVLDDYHLIEVRPIQEIMSFLLDHLPPQLHLALASRADPPLPLARLRGRGALTELRAADLRFTPGEAALFLNQVMDLGLSAEHVDALEARTEGWIAGLQMAALSMQGRADSAGFIQAFTGSHHYIIDYLVEEVLHRQTEQVRNFLLQTAILDRLSGPLCDLVTGQADGSAMLPALERANLFVVPLDDRRQWYRYHHLFADVLRARFREAQPDQVPILHRRASQWYEQNDFPVEAVRHALAAQDFERAASLVERAWPGVARSRQDATLRAWLKALPDALVRRRPVLSVYYAGALLVVGEMEAVEPRLRDAERWLETAAETSEGAQAPAGEQVVANEDELRKLPSQIAIYRAALAQARGDAAGTAQHARQALAHVQTGDHLGHGAAAGLLGLALWASGELDAALRTFGEARISLQLAGNLSDALSSTLILADMYIVQGRLREADRAYEQALQLAAAQGEPAPPATADLYVGLSELLRERDELEAAARHLHKSKALGEHASLAENRYRWHVAMARLLEAQGDLDGALDRLGEAERLYLRGFFPEVRPIAALRARIWIAQGRLAEALRWARDRGLSAADDLSYLREFDHLTLARLLLAQSNAGQDAGALREALDLLGRLLAAAEAGGRAGSVNEILVLQALAHAAQGNTSQALPPLERALAQAEPEDYVRLFAGEGPPLAALLREAAQRGITPGYVGRLLGAIGESAPPAVGQVTTPAGQPLPEPLSEREREVLRLLRTELSGPEIARQLVVSLNTFHTHTKNIYGKLGVKNRQAAVRRADELNLS